MTIHAQINSNKTKTMVFMGGFVLFFTLILWVLGQVMGYGPEWLWFALGISLLTNIGSLYWGDTIILTMSGARPADRKRDFDFFTVAENLAIAAGIPKPKLYV